MENTKTLEIIENTKENVVKLLNAIVDVSHSSADLHKEDPIFASFMRKRANCYQDAIWLITDEGYFNDIWNIYFRKEGEN